MQKSVLGGNAKWKLARRESTCRAQPVGYQLTLIPQTVTASFVSSCSPNIATLTTSRTSVHRRPGSPKLPSPRPEPPAAPLHTTKATTAHFVRLRCWNQQSVCNTALTYQVGYLKETAFRGGMPPAAAMPAAAIPAAAPIRQLLLDACCRILAISGGRQGLKGTATPSENALVTPGPHMVIADVKQAAA